MTELSPTEAALAGRLCLHLHAPEWESPVPRQHPCQDCCTTSAALVAGGCPMRLQPISIPQEFR